MTDPVKLEPCPFPSCASPHTHVTEVFISGKGGQYAGTCDACQCTGPCLTTQAAAIAAWNNRQPTQPAPGVSGDWVLVPREPTPEMQEAAEISDREYTQRQFGNIATVRQGPWDTYVAMIAASPAAPWMPEAGKFNALAKAATQGDQFTAAQQSNEADSAYVVEQTKDGRKYIASDIDYANAAFIAWCLNHRSLISRALATPPYTPPAAGEEK